jgi:DMSO reductase family type II enzyme heme b subunit
MSKRNLALVLSAWFCLLLAACSRGPLQDTQQVAAKLIAQALPLEDPASPLWEQATEHPAKLMVQDVAEPKLVEPGVTLVKVRALHNRDWVVFRLEWSDPTRDLIPVSGRSSDAAALQFPLAQTADVPDATMGQAGKGVRIWYWKAVWQDDALRAQNGGADRVATAYPNASVDHYPFNANPAAKEEMARRYAPAHAAANPIFTQTALGPVQVLMAEGFGNTQVTPEQSAKGRGNWVAGNWVTTIARPLRGGAALGDLDVGKRGYVAVAVWDGAKAHAGSRKMRSGWIPFILGEK